MELKLQNTNFFEKGIELKIKQLIEENLFELSQDKNYSIEISYSYFHIEIEQSVFSEIEDYNLDESQSFKGYNKDLFEKAFTLQGKKIQNLIEKIDLKWTNLAFVGDAINKPHEHIIVRIEEKEILKIPRQRKKQPYRTVSYMANNKHTISMLAKIISERLSEIFNLLYESAGHEVTAEIMEVPITSTETQIWRAFTDKYHELAGFPGEVNKQLAEEFKQRILEVLEKRRVII